MRRKDRRSAASSISDDRRRGRDRRTYERFETTVKVDYAYADAELYGYTGDVSEVGLFIRTRVPYPPGTRLKLAFQPKGRAAIEVDAEVVWASERASEQHPAGMGVRFDGLSAEQREVIRKLVGG